MPLSTQLLPSWLTSHTAGLQGLCSELPPLPLLSCRLQAQPLLDMLPLSTPTLSSGRHSSTCLPPLLLCHLSCMAPDPEDEPSVSKSRQRTGEESTEQAWEIARSAARVAHALRLSLLAVACPPHVLRCMPVCYPTRGDCCLPPPQMLLLLTINIITGPSHC